MVFDLIYFFSGFVIGGAIVWYLRQKELDATKQNQDELKKSFSDLSNEVLIDSQKIFFFLRIS
jgi:hypothetical protein